MTESTREFYKITNALSDEIEYGGDCAEVCERCPYYKRCNREELFFKCAVWEQAQGDDL